MSEQSSPTTKGTPPQLVETVTPLKSLNTGEIFNQVKAQVLTPEEALKKAEAELAKTHGRRFVIPSVQSRSSQYAKACAERETFDQNKQPFIFPGLTPEKDFYLSQGLTLVGAKSGNSKSTTAANILAGFLEYKPDTTALVISNEELTDAIIHRTACVLERLPYMQFHNHSMPEIERQRVIDTAQRVLERVVVVNDPDWDTTTLEDVMAILEGSAAQGVSLVMIDYYQTITKSKKDPEAEPFRVLKQFGAFIRKYGMRCPVPVLVMCQLNPKSMSGTDFQARVQNDKTIYNDAFNVVEIEPDFESMITTFTIHKQRFGVSQGVKVLLKFNRGIYEQWAL